MTRQRRNAPSQAPGRDRRRSSTTDQIRRRLRAEPEAQLSEEELRALADEGIDVEELRRAASLPEEQEASPHDRDTPRDQLETLVEDEEY